MDNAGEGKCLSRVKLSVWLSLACFGEGGRREVEGVGNGSRDLWGGDLSVFIHSV
jgi:hypothetical protein